VGALSLFKLNNIIMERDKEFDVGDQVQITQGSENWGPEMDKYVGKIANIKSVRVADYSGDYIYKLDVDGGTWNWWPSKGHFIHAPQHGLDQKDELLYRAEQMFSVGTKFCPAHQVDENEIKEGTHCIITDNTSFEFDDSGNIFAKAGGRRWFMSEVTEYGNTSYDRVVYLARDKKWAYIYPKEEGFKVGDKVMITQSENNWCPEMDEFIGKLATLTRTKGSKGTHFGIDLDKSEWAWSDKDGHFRKPTQEELLDDTTPIEESKPTFKFKVGDWVIGNHRANGIYAMTNEGWSGQVTNVRDSDGYIDVKGKYNDDNDHYLRLDPDRFDLTTEGELMALVAKPSYTLTATTTPASYTLTSVDSGEKLRIDSSGSIGISQPVVQTTFRVKKVSFNRI
jgi:hypothetical protein